MKINKPKTMSILSIAIIIASMTLLATELQPAKAQLAPQQPISGPLPAGVTVNASVTIRPFLSFRPTVVGLGQSILVNMYVTPAPGAARKLLNYKVTITKPDGTTDIHTTDSRWDDGTAWFEYTVTQVGTWKLKFEFPGTYLPPGRYLEGNIITASTGGTVYTDSAYYNPVQTGEQTLTVQQDMVASWPPSPLPTDYWNRPVQAVNRDWWPILGNYPWPFGNANYDYAGPFVIAPNTAHVAWKRQGGVYGLIGGEMGQWTLDASASIGAAGGGNPTIIYAGRAYETYLKAGVGNVAECYDIRTGEQFYSIPTSQGGVTPQYLAYTSSNAELIAINGGYMQKIDPWTGLVTTNVSISPLTSGTFYNGAYFLSVQNLGSGKGYRLINWTSTGSSSSLASRIANNITWPWSSIGTCQDFNTGVAVQISGITQGGAYVGQTVRAASLKSGLELWNTTIEEPTFSGSCNVADNGMVAVHNDRGYFRCFDLLTGREVWKSETFDYPWDAPGFGAYDIASAYGLIFRSAYSAVYAVNWTNGKIAWKYESPNNPFETPYIDANGTTVSSWNGGILVADGKVYDYNTEHSPTQPITRGWKLHAINATTGQGVWNITAFSGSRDFRGAVADGYLAFDNFYDGFMYVFGKGKSATTVTAPDVAMPQGTAMVIKGTVLDQSPAQKGTPCVSVDSMTTQMEYLHMQYPIDGLYHNLTITGVPVALTAIGPDGNYIDLGTVTTDGYYGTFSKTWTPPAEGDYKILASFTGDDSYGSSSASTSLSVGPAPTQVVIPEQVTPPDYTMAIFGSAIAVIIAVALVGILLYRKK